MQSFTHLWRIHAPFGATRKTVSLFEQEIDLLEKED